MPHEDDHGDEHMSQDLFDCFVAVDNGDGTQDDETHAALKALAEAGVKKGDL